MLVANDRLEGALKELEALKVLTPKESLVYFLIGKVSTSETLCKKTTINMVIMNIVSKFLLKIHAY